MGDFMTNDHCQRAVVDISGRETLHIVISGLVSKNTVVIPRWPSQLGDSRADVSSVSHPVIKAL